MSPRAHWLGGGQYDPWMAVRFEERHGSRGVESCLCASERLINGRDRRGFRGIQLHGNNMLYFTEMNAVFIGVGGVRRVFWLGAEIAHIAEETSANLTE